jgi:hypothetical protein
MKTPNCRTICLCDLCNRVSPKAKAIRAALSEELQKDFDYLMSRMMHAEDDLDYAEARLRGEWPGWEWIIEARQKAEFAPKPETAE